MLVRTSRAALLLGALFLGQAVVAVAVCPPSGACACHMVARVYPVADLVVPHSTDGKTLEGNLIKTIESSVCPDSWADAGGHGTTEYHPLTLSLVINQTTEVHDRVASLLTTLRRQMDKQVVLEMRIIRVSSEAVKSLGLEQHSGEGPPAVAMINDSQVRTMLEKVQSDRLTSVMQAPKITTFSGQKATIEVGDRRSFVTSVETVTVDGRKTLRPRTETFPEGIAINALPTVSADGRYVKVHLGVKVHSIDNPVRTIVGVYGVGADSATGKSQVMTQQIQEPCCHKVELETTLVIPDGGTALLSGWTTQRETRTQFGPPVLSRIPYINRLFTNVGIGRTSEHMIVLVTPRVIISEEQEEVIKHAPAQDAAATDVEESETATSTDTKPSVTPSVSREVPVDQAEPLYVKDRKFQLTYDLDNVGTSQVKHVEVWWTKDANAWERFSDDVKPTGKVVIAVKDDGTYGFRLNARSGAGLAAPAPKAGDRPHTWVVVDTTAPVVKLHAVEFSSNDGEVLFKWSAKDQNLAARPVTLRYSENADGPWKDLVVHGAADDSHRCSVSKLPPVCYFRVDATDRAGNVGTATTAEPIKIDLKVPMIRNVSVKPNP